MEAGVACNFGNREKVTGQSILFSFFLAGCWTEGELALSHQSPFQWSYILNEAPYLKVPKPLRLVLSTGSEVFYYMSQLWIFHIQTKMGHFQKSIPAKEDSKWNYFFLLALIYWFCMILKIYMTSMILSFIMCEMT